MYTPTLLLILDGYGLAPAGAGNAVYLAKTPCLNRLIGLPMASTAGVMRLEASGRAVGLPDGSMGNSEVGHLNIGAGRVVYQDMTRIDLAIENGELAHNRVFQELLTAVKKSSGRLHLLGLLSDGGVHSHIRHLESLIQIAHEADVPVQLDMFLDGRDTAPTSGVGFLQRLKNVLVKYKKVKLGTICGRFYAMDRDKRWDRVQMAWDLLVKGKSANESQNANEVQALTKNYAQGETDEFVKPMRFGTPDEVRVHDGDALFFFNFRADRARELVSAFYCKNFTAFDRDIVPHLAGLATMTAYDENFHVPVAFEKKNIDNCLGEVISHLGLHQLRIAETEKYAHVTYFFNGGREKPFAGEDRILVESPRDVPTYDYKPEMSLYEVTDKLIAAWQKKIYNFVVCNFANPDMVGHTGNIDATIKALEAVDMCVQRILNILNRTGGRLMLTADHGNCEELLDAQGQPQTAHTCNQVPFLIYESSGNGSGQIVPVAGVGKLGDIAPTLLKLWNITPPENMTGLNVKEVD